MNAKLAPIPTFLPRQNPLAAATIMPIDLNHQLFLATQNEDFELMERLCAQGARGDVFFDNEHALFWAVLHRRVDLAKRLLPFSNARLVDEHQSTPLMLAVINLHAEMVQLLLPVSDLRARDIDYDDALDWLLNNSLHHDPSENGSRRRLAILRIFAQADPQLVLRRQAQGPAASELAQIQAEIEAAALASSLEAAPSKPAPRM